MNRRSPLRTLAGGDDGRDLFSGLQDEIDRVFGRFRDLAPLPGAMPTESGRDGALVPRCDVIDGEDALTVEAELPGLERDEIDVSVSGQTLTVEGRHESESTRSEKDYRVMERSSGRYLRRIPLGFEADADKVQAGFRNGVLTVRVEKPAESRTAAKKIEVRETEPA